MEAILYAAGRATRLGATLKVAHKVLLKFGGKTLLERHVLLLRRFGIRTLHIVTGHRREKLEAAFPVLMTRYNLSILEHYNPDFVEGSILSMHRSIPALEKAAGPVLLMDADVLYDHRMLGRLIESKAPTALLVDRGYSTADDDPVLVPMRNGRPFDFAKKWQGEADAIGESIGFFKIAPEDLPWLIRETQARVQRGARGDSYDDVLRVLVKEGRFGAEDVTGLPWTEIDFPGDIEYATRVVLPALE